MRNRYPDSHIWKRSEAEHGTCEGAALRPRRHVGGEWGAAGGREEEEEEEGNLQRENWVPPASAHAVTADEVLRV